MCANAAGNGLFGRKLQIPGRDTLVVPIDTLSLSTPTDTTAIENSGEEEKEFINATIFYNADTIVFDAINERILLFGNAVVKYEKIELQAGHIVYEMAENQVTAQSIPDSSGTNVSYPVFKEGTQIFDAKLIKYNFRTGKAYIESVITEQSEMFLHSNQTTRLPNEQVHIRNGKFTTCSKENPHYHFHITRGIVIPDDKIVSGPLYMKIRKAPTPLALPFGFFPNKRTSSHGIVLPTFGDGASLGYFLRDGGYYLPLGEIADTRLLADIYTRGSWTVRNITNYRVRYKFNGSFNISRTVFKRGLSELPTFKKDTEFFLRWSHNQDAKARPGNTFSANVNAGTRNNFTNNINSSQNDYLSNTFQSGISWSKQWQNKPYNLRANLRHAQNSNSRNVDFTLPSVAFNVSRFEPLAKVGPGGLAKKKWYQEIGMNYSTELENRATVPDSLLQLNNLSAVGTRFRNGIRHTAGLRTSLKAGYVSIVPAVNFTEVWYLDQLLVGYDQEANAEVRDTLNGFTRGFDMNASVTANTKIFGTFNFRNAKRLTAIRHVITPNVGFSWRPETGDEVSVAVPDTINPITYSPLDIGVFGRVGGPASGSITYGVMNNLEMKWKERKGDKPETKKIKIIDSYRLGGAYDLMRDSLRFSDIAASGFTAITEKVNINYNASYSLYDRDTLGRLVDNMLISTQNKLWRMQSTGIGLTLTFKGQQKEKKEQEKEPNIPEEEMAFIDRNRSEFVDFNMPWALNCTYSLNLQKQFDQIQRADTNQITQSILVNGDFTVLKRWKVGFNSGYDFTSKELTPTTLNLYWDLHCWELAVDYIPFGIRKSYAIRLNVKAAVLQDLKLQRRRNLSQGDLLL